MNYSKVGLMLMGLGTLLSTLVLFSPLSSDKVIIYFGICSSLISSGATLMGTDKND